MHKQVAYWWMVHEASLALLYLASETLSVL